MSFLDVAGKLIFYIIMPLLQSTLADFTFTHYKDNLLRLRKFGIVGAKVVTSISKCERACIEHRNGCQAANLVPIRKGLYSCELISDTAFTIPVDLEPAKGSVFIQKRAPDICDTKSCIYRESCTDCQNVLPIKQMEHWQAQSGAGAVAILKARCELECQQLCERYTNITWPCQTIQYQEGNCILYAQSILHQGWNNSMVNNYWTRKLSIQGWIPIFRAYRDSGLRVYDAWINKSINLGSGEGVSPLLEDQSIWKLIKQVKFSMLSDNDEVMYIIFNATGSTPDDWFNRDRIVQSNYNNVTSEEYIPDDIRMFSAFGLENLDFKVRRSFYAYWHHEGCPKDMGWSVVLDESSGFCPWETNSIRPSFMYCSESDPCLFTTMQFAEMMVITALF